MHQMSTTFPTQEALFSPLLMAIAERGGDIDFSLDGLELEVQLADRFNLTEEQRHATSERVNAKGKREWRNHIQWARMKLVELGYIDNSVRSHWTITDAGLRHIALTRQDVTSIVAAKRLEKAFLSLTEGGLRTVRLSKIERNRKVRKECLRHYGPTCVVCGYNFANEFGTFAEFLIHVHHLKPMAEAKSVRDVDPVSDCRPVCPNCHAVIHMYDEMRTIENVVFLRNVRTAERDR